MRYRGLTLTALAAALVVVACQDRVDDKSLTAPDADISFAKQLGGTCDAARLRAITSQQADLWVNPTLATSRDMFESVTANCGNPAGKGLMLDYIQWTIENRTVDRKSGATDALMLTHWNTVFPYVGYTGQDQPSNVPETIFSTSGAVGVIDGDSTGEITAAKAALTSYAQDSAGDQRDHLFVIYPINPNCLTGTNLQQSGPCFMFSAFPHVDPKFSPKVKVGICQELHFGENFPLTSPSLGHLDPITRITEAAGTYPAFCDDVVSTPAGSWNNGFGDVVKRLAWHAKRAVTPEPLYAVHGGLGGLGGGLSPFGAVDLEVFRETFTNDVAGQPPGTPETGTWSIVTLTPPGTILVQNSLGQQNSKLVVLNQSGGNCAKNCGGLYLRGNLEASGPAAKDGIYEAEFVALQSQSNMKEAVFALRDTADANIATVTFAVRNNTNVIIYNDKQAGPTQLLGNWVQNVPVRFRIQVDLDNDRTTVWVGNATTPSFADKAFVGNAKNLARIVADFRGIDSGTMGWDDIIVKRLADLNH